MKNGKKIEMEKEEILKILIKQHETLGGLIQYLERESDANFQDPYVFELATKEVEKKLRAVSAGTQH